MAAIEILLDTPRIRELVKRGEVELLKDAMERGAVEGCRTFDMALLELIAAGRIGPAEALRSADSPNNLRLAIERRAGPVVDSDAPLRLLPVAPVRKR